MQAVTTRTRAAVLARGERRRHQLKLPPRPIGSDDLAREPGSFIIFGRALPGQREHGPALKLVEGLARRAFRLSLGVLLEGLADAGEGDGGHFVGALTACYDGVSLPVPRARGDRSKLLVLERSAGLSGARKQIPRSTRVATKTASAAQRAMEPRARV